MINQEVVQLVDRFQRIELHAAHSGREVLRVLINLLLESKETSVSGLTEVLHENISFLLPSLPPYAPPLNNINRILLLLENASTDNSGVDILKNQLEALSKDTTDPISNRKRIAQDLAAILPPNAVVYTHTLSETVLGVLLELHHMEKLKSVRVTESRPNNDGWETAKRLAEKNLSVQITIDAAMPATIENSHLMLSGAEIINQDGSVVGKIGAYPAAVFCQKYGKPLYIVADSNKINRIQWSDFYFNPISAQDLGMDFTNPSLHITGSFFDITPPNLINAYATEVGIIEASEIPSIISNMPVSGWLVQQLREGLQETRDF